MTIEDATEFIKAICPEAVRRKKFTIGTDVSGDNIPISSDVTFSVDFSAVVYRCVFGLEQRRLAEKVLLYQGRDGKLFINPECYMHTPNEIDQVVKSIINFIMTHIRGLPIAELVIAFDGAPSEKKIRHTNMPDDMKHAFCTLLDRYAQGCEIDASSLTVLDRMRIDAAKYSYCDDFDILFVRALFMISRLGIFGWEKIAESFFNYYPSKLGTRWFFQNANAHLFTDTIAPEVSMNWIRRIMPIMRAKYRISRTELQRLCQKTIICEAQRLYIQLCRFQKEQKLPVSERTVACPTHVIGRIECIPAKTEADFVIMQKAIEAREQGRPHIILASDGDFTLTEGETYLFWPGRNEETTKIIDVRLFWCTLYMNYLRRTTNVGTFADICEFLFCAYVSRGTDYTGRGPYSVAKLIDNMRKGYPLNLHYEGQEWFDDSIWKKFIISRCAYYTKLCEVAITEYESKKQTEHSSVAAFTAAVLW